MYLYIVRLKAQEFSKYHKNYSQRVVRLANQLGVQLHAVVAGTGIKNNVEEQIRPYGVDKLFVFDGEGYSLILQLLILKSSLSYLKKSNHNLFDGSYCHWT